MQEGGGDRGTGAAGGGPTTREKLEALGPVSVGKAMGHGAGRLLRERRMLGLFSARPRTQPYLPLGRRRAAGDLRQGMPDVFRGGAVEWARPDSEGAFFRAH